MKRLIQYFCAIKLDKAVLWCYLIWYVVTVCFYFDPSLTLWSNSIGISAVIGTGLVLSVSSRKGSDRDRWQIFRLYLMPLCVSSFSALIIRTWFYRICIAKNRRDPCNSSVLCSIFVICSSS